MTQLCLTIPALPAPEGVNLILRALTEAKIAAVIITPVDSANGIAPASALPIVAAVQKSGAAALIYDDARLARTVKADGVHLAWSIDVRTRADEAREILGQGGIVGAEAGSSRHDAMELGEFGVDYVAFAASPDTEAESGVQHELVTWWAEIFEVPVVALDVTEINDAVEFVDAQAEFVGVTVTSMDALHRLRAIAAAIGASAPQPV